MDLQFKNDYCSKSCNSLAISSHIPPHPSPSLKNEELTGTHWDYYGTQDLVEKASLAPPTQFRERATLNYDVY